MFKRLRPSWNTTESHLFGLPIPQPISDDWTIDPSFKITGGMLHNIMLPIDSFQDWGNFYIF